MYRADKIRSRQAELGWSNEVFAEKARVNVNTVTALRKGQMVSIPTLNKAADALGLSMKELFTPKMEEPASASAMA
jgi:transcriptional regulator with XRE-family HTH domain